METAGVQQSNEMHSAVSAAPVVTPLKTPPSSLEDHNEPVPVPPSEVEERGIGVAVRVRPLSTAELANSTLGNCIHCLKQSIVIGGSSSTNAGSQTAKGLASSKMSLKPRQFDVDAVYHQHTTQKQVYEESCRHIVEGLFDGTNGAILAYGATGSGKTHTMFGGMMSAGGIVYQAVQDIFDEKIRLEEEERKQVVVKCSFVEIYNENVFDLLAAPRKQMVHGRSLSGTSTELLQNGNNNNHNDKIAQWVNGRPSLPIREGGKSSEDQCNPETLQIPGLTYVFPKFVEEFAQAIEKGRSNRFVACTAANAQSSRSHAIITIEVQISGGFDYRGRPCPGTVARIRMCDLAGSERAASSSNSGIRLREGGNINRSLLALGSVVQSLLQRKQNQNKQKVFIPYRGSSLTRLLKDSIGGNCRTQMIFCLNPSTKQHEESINTMLFAMKARQVQVIAQRNEFSVNSAEVAKNQELLIEELRQQIFFYEEELQRAGVVPQYDSKTFSTGLTTARFRHETISEKKFKTVVELSNAAAVGLSSSTETSNDNRQDSQPQCFPSINLDGLEKGITGTPLKATSMRQRKSFTADSSPMFVEREKKLKDLMAEKESQYWKNREAKERIVARDLQLRELNWKLAQFLASNELGVRIRGDPRTTSGGTVATPVGVAGMRNTIAAVENDQMLESSEIQFMMEDIERIDRQIEAIRNEIPREKHSTVLELLFDNMKLRQNCTEAEHLASDYHQECRQTKGRINEYQEALSVCVSALHSVIPHLPHNSNAMADAKLALFYANLPHAKTEEMLRVFEASLVADSTPPLVPSGPSVFSSSPSKSRHPYYADDQMQTIHDLEESFHTLTSSPPRRSQGLPLNNTISSSPFIPPALVDVSGESPPEKGFMWERDDGGHSYSSSQDVVGRKNVPFGEPEAGENRGGGIREPTKTTRPSGRAQTSNTTGGGGGGGSGAESKRKKATKDEQTEKEKETPTTQETKASMKRAACVSKIAKATNSKLAPFTRFYSSLSHLQSNGTSTTSGTTSNNTSVSTTSTISFGPSATAGPTSTPSSSPTPAAASTREFSGGANLNNTGTASSSSSPSFSRSSNTPTRRRMLEASNSSVGAGATPGKHSAEPRPASPGGYTRYPVSSPMRARRPMDLVSGTGKRTSVGATVHRNQPSLRNGASNKNAPSTVKHVPGSLVGESPPKRTSPHRLVHHSANHAVVVEESVRLKNSPVSKDPSRVWVRRSGDGPNMGNSTHVFQRTPSNQHSASRAKPSTPPPAPPPPSIPGLATATPPSKVQTVIAKRITKESRYRPDARAVEAGRAAAPDDFLEFSPVSERSKSKTLPPAGSALYHQPLGSTPIISALSIDDDMQVSRSTFSDLDELSSTMSQTPRDWVYRV